MWLSDRRNFLLAAAALAGCGFTPAYGPQGGGSALLGSIALEEPANRYGYDFNSRFEERLGRASGPYALKIRLETQSQGLGSLADGQTTRYRLVGRVFYTLTPVGSEEALIAGRTNAFTSYSATGSTAATQAAERDAKRRLMVILADQVIDRLLLDADTLPK
ncbi:LPS assembly lipoprotein LptE [Salipiger sp. P9]|uniref:LPS assembly lipoprotein LptE n=1 Tax=Salipiger pentaromativorans TaxID=2943193 RepID=UPI0021581AC7|nr:LPS assembly lipoprotein LptE [Salipiger pentaromativorans]MCR8549325.1 LPS assembly lipoprotein LptE [Salipiger pentaromativorans]